jgi:nucleoporin NUP159
MELTVVAVDTKESEIKRLFAVQNDPSAAARARARLLAPEQQIQQRQLRKTFTRVEKSLKDTEYKATMFKARIAARNRHRSQAKFVPPTVEAVRTTVLKLTDMAERKNRDVEHLEERVRRLRIRSGSATPSRSFGTPERELRGRWGAAQTPVLALVEEADVEEVRSENLRRREAGKKLKGALQRRGGRITDGGP